MVTLRCTRKLLARLQAASVADAGEPPTTALGDWVGTVVFGRPAHIVVCVSERTLLPVLVPAAPVSSLPARLPPAVGEMLLAIGVSDVAAAEEVAAMSPVRIGRTTNRRVVGTMVDFVRMLPDELERGASLLEASVRLAETPCSVLGMESPWRETLRTLNLPH